MSSLQLHHLKSTYKFLYPDLDLDNAVISSSCYKCASISTSGNEYNSLQSRSSRSACIVSYWTATNGKISNMEEMSFQPRPGLIEYFIKHCILISNESLEHWFGFCKWHLPVEDEIKHKFGKPMEVWHKNHFEDMGPSSFIPLQRIFAKAVYAEFTYKSRELIVIAPRVKHSLVS